MTDIRDHITRNLNDVKDQIAAACKRAGRSSADVRLVAVTKYAQLEWVQALSELHPVFGENRPQQLAERAPQFPEAEWHLIGQLQRNKARIAVQHAGVIHSVDSLRLLERVTSISAELNRRPRILLQVNVSGETEKSGFEPQALIAKWPEVAACQSQVEISGLMTMAPATQDPETTRCTFRGLAELRSEIAQHSSTISNGIQLSDLSMGMSGDFQIAIEEGATLVRIGSRLYEGLA